MTSAERTGRLWAARPLFRSNARPVGTDCGGGTWRQRLHTIKTYLETYPFFICLVFHE